MKFKTASVLFLFVSLSMLSAQEPPSTPAKVDPPKVEAAKPADPAKAAITYELPQATFWKVKALITENSLASQQIALRQSEVQGTLQKECELAKIPLTECRLSQDMTKLIQDLPPPASAVTPPVVEKAQSTDGKEAKEAEAKSKVAKAN